MSDSKILMDLTVAILPIVGIFMAFTPYLMRKNECFAVTVPSAAARDPYLKGLKCRFLILMAGITTVLTVLALVFVALDAFTAAVVVFAIGVLTICLIGYALMLHFRKETIAYKRRCGWSVRSQEAVAFAGEGHVPHAISLKWNLLYLPVLAVTALIGIIGYDRMPDLIAVHVGFGGVANSWVDKSPLVVLLPLAIQAFLVVCLVFSHWTITRSKQPSDPQAPATSALAYGMFAHAQSIYLLATGLSVCIAMIAMPLSFMSVVTLMQSGVLLMVVALLVLCGSIALGVVYGQGGARVFSHIQGDEVLLADEDSFWKWGIFYFNSGDSSLFLPERFGIGWTINWARPAVWTIMAACAVVVVGFVVVVTMLF
jgi:uncharacterized membrane protein